MLGLQMLASFLCAYLCIASDSKVFAVGYFDIALVARGLDWAVELLHASLK